MNIKKLFKNKYIIIILIILILSFLVFTYKIKESFELHFPSENCYELKNSKKCEKQKYPGCFWLPNNQLDDGKGVTRNIDDNFILSSDETEINKILKTKCKAYQDFKCSLFDGFRENCLNSYGCYYSYDNKCKNVKENPCNSLGEKQSCNDNPKCAWYTTGSAALGNQISKCLNNDICNVKNQDQCDSAGPPCYWYDNGRGTKICTYKK